MRTERKTFGISRSKEERGIDDIAGSAGECHSMNGRSSRCLPPPPSPSYITTSVVCECVALPAESSALTDDDDGDVDELLSSLGQAFRERGRGHTAFSFISVRFAMRWIVREYVTRQSIPTLPPSPYLFISNSSKLMSLATMNQNSAPVSPSGWGSKLLGCRRRLAKVSFDIHVGTLNSCEPRGM